MKGRISITLEDGSIFNGEVNVAQESTASSLSKANSPERIGHGEEVSGKNKELDFSLPIRPFMHDYAGELSGSKKFALLVAHFAQGELDVYIDRAEIVETWTKMTGLLGKFNTVHEARAKDSGYIYVPEAGKVALLKKWRQALS